MTTLTFNGDCLEVMKDISANSIDLLFCDLPYGETSCKWDTKINLDLFWKEVNRICKLNCPMFFTTTTRFGAELINSNPKNFRYDLVWVKSAGTGFLNAKKMPMRKHEMIYVFYRKLPLYDLSSHKHKFLDHTNVINELQNDTTGLYGTEKKKIRIYQDGKIQNYTRYDPPLPNSVIQIRGKTKEIKEDVYNADERFINGKLYHYPRQLQKGDDSIYEPPLPNSILEIKSEKGKHATQKPVELIKWILKYYSKEGDNVLDPTMGSGSTGVACKELKRNFIGIEKDEKIYNDAIERLG